jgi:hypothetical protein
MGIVGSQLAVVAGEFIPSDSFELLDNQVKFAYIVLHIYIMFNDFSCVMISVVEPESELQQCIFLLVGTGTHSGSGSCVHPFRLLGLPTGHEHFSVNITFFAL